MHARRVTAVRLPSAAGGIGGGNDGSGGDNGGVGGGDLRVITYVSQLLSARHSPITLSRRALQARQRPLALIVMPPQPLVAEHLAWHSARLVTYPSSPMLVAPNPL